MTSRIRRIIWNTRERIASTDFNDATALIHRAMVDSAASLSGRRSGVVHGLQCSISGSDMDVTVSAGLALYDVGSPSGDDSEFDWIELVEATSVTLDAADGANPRWDAIEIAAGDAVELSALRDVYNPALGTFTPQTLEKRRTSAPTVTVRTGTPAAIPQFPTGDSGVVPLAYIYVPASAATLTTGDEVLCRPMLHETDTSFQAHGGGIDTARTAAASVYIGPSRGRFEGAHSRWNIDGGSRPTLEALSFLGGSLPGSDGWVYLYACPPPYPSGYDSSLAMREFTPGSAAHAYFRTAVDGFTGAIMVADTESPELNESLGGAPASVTGDLTDESGFGTVTVDRENLTYLGAAYLDVSELELGPQRTEGGSVRMQVGSGFTPTWPPQVVLSAGLSTQTAQSYGLGTPDTCARQLELEGISEAPGLTTVYELQVSDEYHGDTAFRLETSNSGTGFACARFEVTLDESFQWQMGFDQVSGAASVYARITSFTDSVLANR